MVEFKGFSEASLLYADNYYLTERLEQIFKQEQLELFRVFRHIIEKKEWMDSDKWKIKISGTYFEIGYHEEGKERFFIYLRFGPRDLANKNKEAGKENEGERRSFEIALSCRAVSDLKRFRERFFELAEPVLRKEFETGREYYPTRSTGQALVRRQAEYDLSNLLEVMETEVEKFIKLAEFAKRVWRETEGGNSI